MIPQGTTRAVMLVVAALAPATAPAPAVVAAEPSAARTIERRLELPADGLGPGRLVVDNVWGSIRVEPGRPGVVELVARETLRARSEAGLARAREEVELETRVDGDEVVVRVDGPFRDCDCGGGSGRRSVRRPARDYEAHYDLELRVPPSIALDLRTVLDGDVEVHGTRGRFEVANVNGGIEMTDVRGSGDAVTVNGPVRITFAATPEDACRFRTINGPVEVTFPGELSADLAFKTMNGEIWTDYDARPLPAALPAAEDARGGRVIRMDRWNAVRVGQGGARFEFETLNGDIVIRNARARATRNLP